MSNASLKEQLQAVTGRIPEADKKIKQQKPMRQPSTKPSHQRQPGQRPSRPEKPKWLEYAQYGVELLRAYFPLCFKASDAISPLKKGIKLDLVKRLSTMEAIVTEDKACMVKSLSYYVNTMSYHKSVVEGATRLNLDGNPEGVVTAEEAKYSTERSQLKLKAKQQATLSE